jgi:predicted phosphodiesterase
LHIIAGNHDLRNGSRNPVEKDGLVAHEALILCHTRTGQRLFVTHGHQGDPKNDRYSQVSRLLVRIVWHRLQALGRARITSPDGQTWRVEKSERALLGWVRNRTQVTICGHTHVPRSAMFGAPPYFNAGSCVFPGYITGLELRCGEISLVSWSSRATTRAGKPTRVERQLVAPPRRLRALES